MKFGPVLTIKNGPLAKRVSKTNFVIHVRTLARKIGNQELRVANLIEN